MSSDPGYEIAMNSPYIVAAREASEAGSEILKSYFGKLRSIEEKFQAGLVSEADRESEALISKVLKKHFPDYLFLGEESSDSYEVLKSNGGVWVVDPLDGTTNYVHQFPYFCVSIGLQIAGQLEAAWIEAPLLNLRFMALRGKGAYLNGSPLRVSGRTQIRDALFATGFSSHDPKLDDQLKLASHIVPLSRGIRRAGAAALDLCYVASGSFDVFWERNLKPWDTAAGTLIVREAGGHVKSFSGQDYEIKRDDILAGSPAMVKNFLEIYQKTIPRPRVP